MNGEGALEGPERTRPTARDLAALATFTTLVLFLGNWNMVLAEHDPPRVAGIARAMALTGDFVVPRLNGTPFLEYPPLGYHPAAAALALAGRPSEFAAHVPNVVLGVATVLVTALIGVGLGGRRMGLASGYLLGTTAKFFSLHQEVLVDPALLLAITGAFAGFCATWSRGSAVGGAFLGLALSAGFLAKGLIGVGLPVVGIALFVGCAPLAGIRRPPGVPWARALGLPWSPIMAAAPVLLWASLLWAREGGELVREVVYQSVWRFASPDAHHANPWYFYLFPVLLRTLPLALIALVFFGVRAWRARPGEPPLLPRLALPLAWFGAVFVVLSAASAKRLLYLAPLYPAGALLGAALWERAVARAPRLRLLGVVWLAGFVAFAGIGAARAPTAADRDASYRPLLDWIAAERGGNRVLLYRPTEGLEGAHVFFTGETAPEVHSLDALREALSDGRPTVVVMEFRGLDENPLDALEPAIVSRAIREVRVGRSRIVVALANP